MTELIGQDIQLTDVEPDVDQSHTTQQADDEWQFICLGCGHRGMTVDGLPFCACGWRYDVWIENCLKHNMPNYLKYGLTPRPIEVKETNKMKAPTLDDLDALDMPEDAELDDDLDDDDLDDDDDSDDDAIEAMPLVSCPLS